MYLLTFISLCSVTNPCLFFCLFFSVPEYFPTLSNTTLYDTSGRFPAVLLSAEAAEKLTQGSCSLSAKDQRIDGEPIFQSYV